MGGDRGVSAGRDGRRSMDDEATRSRGENWGKWSLVLRGPNDLLE
jgi:hypothetical protein